MFQLDSLSCDIVWPMDTYMRLSLWSSMVRCSSFFCGSIQSGRTVKITSFQSTFRWYEWTIKEKTKLGWYFSLNSIQFNHVIKSLENSAASSWETEFKFIRMEIKALKITFSRKNNFNFNSKNLNIRRNSNECFFKC